MQGVRDVGVGAVGRCGAVPRRLVGVVAADGVGQRPVHLSPLEAGGRLVHRRSDQRVPHRDDVTGDGEQAGRSASSHAVACDARARPARRTMSTRPVESAAATSSSVCTASLQPAAPVEEGALHARGQGELLRHRCLPVQLVRGSARWAAPAGRAGSRRSRRPGARPRRRAGGHRRARRAAAGRCRARGRRPGARASPSATKAGRAGLLGTRREDHGDRVRGQLTGREQQRVRGCGVEPLRVVHHTQHRAAVARPPRSAPTGWRPRPGTARRWGRPRDRTRRAAPVPEGAVAGRGPATGRSSRCRAAYGIGDSDSTPAVRSTRVRHRRRVGGQRGRATGRSCPRRALPPAPGRRGSGTRVVDHGGKQRAFSGSRP